MDCKIASVKMYKIDGPIFDLLVIGYKNAKNQT